ncbi:recombinase family protein, partial [Rodentibacter caecimuris]|uniref:recombinase family protein n=1 Tax=Rodentibacter caecimuris TaxID=1796644 RepID=UPI00101ADE64
LDGAVDTTKSDDPLAMAMIQLLSVFAELERNFIVTRTMEGKRAKGMLQGRPEKLDSEQFKQFSKDVKSGLSISKLQAKYNIGRATVSRWKKKVLENGN